MKINEITSIIIEESIYIHKALGPGLFESVYENVLAFRLRKRGLNVFQQRSIPVCFEDVDMGIGFKCDLLVENLVIVEIKSVKELPEVASKQLLTYLRLMDLEVGLLINFNETQLLKGLHRIVNGFVEG